MQTKILSQDTSEELIDLSKLQKQVETDGEEVFLSDQLAAAIDFAEGFTHRKFYPTEALAGFDQYQSKVFLPFGEVTHIRALSALNSANTRENIAFTFDDISESIEINARYSYYKKFRCLFVCGYGNKGNDQVEPVAALLPEAIKQGLKMYVATMFDERNDVGINQKGVLCSERFFNRYKIREI